MKPRERNRRPFGRLLIVQATAAAVECIETASIGARKLALARRSLEHRLRRTGMTRSEAARIVAAMPPADVFAAVPWWQRVVQAITRRTRA